MSGHITAREMEADQMHALALQLRLLGEAGGALPAPVVARLGEALRLFANTARRQRRTLDEIVEDARQDEQRTDATRRRARIIAGLFHGMNITLRGDDNG